MRKTMLVGIMVVLLVLSCVLTGCTGCDKSASEDLAYQGDSTDASKATYFIVTGIGGCTETDIVIPSMYLGKPVTGIGNDAFNGNFNITSVSIPNGVMSIGDRAFYGCNRMESIHISASVRGIGESAFVGCTDLVSITVDDGNTVYRADGNCLIRIGSKTLVAGCRNSVIPDDGSVKSIGAAAFAYSYHLKSIYIPASVTSIGKSAFEACIKLETVYYGGTVSEWEEMGIDTTSGGNAALLNATRYYYSETQPTDTENLYWRYVDGVPTAW